MCCPLCNGVHTTDFHSDRRRPYRHCPCCRLVFVPAENRLSPTEEKAEYDLHQNRPDDRGYRRFLSRLLEPLCNRLSSGARGLDFGAGPGPTLAPMFEEAGFPMAIYDHFYAHRPEVLERHYDFVTCTETAEHLFRPGEVFEQLIGILNPGGWLGIMTKLVIDREAFSRWHYKNDPTHVCFFSHATFLWLAAHHACSLEFIGSDVILMQKPAEISTFAKKNR